MSKRVLVIGAHSYIGSSFIDFCNKYCPRKYTVDARNIRDDAWKQLSFAEYDAILDCVGLAHTPERKRTEGQFYKVNRDLAIEVACKAKADGVSQFILISSMSVYGKQEGGISKSTVPSPVSAYGKSKLAADCAIERLADERFAFACLRPPMVYGKGCKGNYNKLRKIALNVPVFPSVDNSRSMVYIGNLCDCIDGVIEQGRGGLFFPQNAEYVSTTRLVELIAREHGRTIRQTSVFNGAIEHLPVSSAKKAFGSLWYEMGDESERFSLEESVHLTEA